MGMHIHSHNSPSNSFKTCAAAQNREMIFCLQILDFAHANGNGTERLLTSLVERHDYCKARLCENSSLVVIINIVIEVLSKSQEVFSSDRGKADVESFNEKRGERWMSYIEGESRNQALLFPEILDDCINQDNVVRFLDVFVDGLRLEELGFGHSVPETTGRPPYDPRDLLKLYLYGYLNGVRSSRRL